MERVRESNVELLRLVCMYFILIHHFIYYFSISSGGAEFREISNFIYPFVCCAVNAFILISGWFGIKLRARSFINLYVQCAFYGLVFYLLHLYLDDAKLGRSILNNTLFVFSNSPGWWFVRVYVYLMLLSPLLNKAIEFMSKYEFRFILLILIVLNVYFGWLWREDVNRDGYNVMQFIFVYMIGRYLALYCDFSNRFKLRKISFAAYVALALIMGLLVYFFKMDLNYNNPFQILISIALFLFFISFNFKSKCINYLAASSLSVYLIHSSSYFTYIQKILKNVVSFSSVIINQYIIIFLLAAIILILSIFTDKIRGLFTKPIVEFSEMVVDKYIKPQLVTLLKK